MTGVTPIIETAWTDEPVRHRRGSIVREFALNTSTHGLPGIARSQSKHNCIFWTISFLIFLGVMIFFVTETIQNYFAYPTQASISITVERTQPFPAVTFCNYAPARFDRVLGSVFNVTDPNDLSYANTFTPDQATQVFNYLRLRLNNNESVDQFFFTLDMMLINCIYNGDSCTKDDFITFLSSQHGRCFTFNAQTTNTTKTNLRWTSDSGGTGKLQLRLYTHNQLYIPYVSQDVSAGIVAMVHDNTQLPRIDIEGIELAPGRKHKIGYKKKTTFFLSSPYTDCTNEVPLVMKAMFDRYQGADYTYSQSLCFILCTQAYIYQECGCVAPDEWSARSVVLPGTDTIIEAALCSFADTCYLQALERFSNSTEIPEQFCVNCSQECSNVNFALTTSSVSAPSFPFASLTKFFVESTGVPLPLDWSSNWLNEVYANYVSLDVVCESTQVENYTQEASISAVDVLSNVGGHTGLWIGISFLSVMEFVEMLYRLLRFEFHAIKTKFQRKKT